MASSCACPRNSSSDPPLWVQRRAAGDSVVRRASAMRLGGTARAGGCAQPAPAPSAAANRRAAAKNVQAMFADAGYKDGSVAHPLWAATDKKLYARGAGGTCQPCHCERTGQGGTPCPRRRHVAMSAEATAGALSMNGSAGVPIETDAVIIGAG